MSELNSCGTCNRQLNENSPTISDSTNINATYLYDSLPLSMDGMNQVDSNGLKQGYWCDVDNYMINYISYKDGKENGMFRSYGGPCMKNRYKLECIGTYYNDTCVNDWLFFEKGDVPIYMVTNISKNKDFLEVARYVNLHPDTTIQSYHIMFNENGSISDEGWCISPYNDLESDLVFKVGIWKYYTPKGIKFVDESASLIEMEKYPMY